MRPTDSFDTVALPLALSELAPSVVPLSANGLCWPECPPLMTVAVKATGRLLTGFTEEVTVVVVVVSPAFTVCVSGAELLLL